MGHAGYWRDRAGARGARLSHIVAVLCVACGVSACNDSNSYVAPPAQKVTVARPRVAEVALYAQYSGNTAASASVTLEARVEGFLTAINVRDGEAVQKGRKLFEIEQVRYQAQVEQAKATLASAKATAANAQRDHERQTELLARQSTSQSKADETRTALATAQAQELSAQASLTLAEANLGYTIITAPFDGVVTRALASVGALVGTSGATKLATIMQVDPLYVYFNITERELVSLRDDLAKAGKTLRHLRDSKLDMSVLVSLTPGDGKALRGRIDYIAPHVDPATGALEMRATLDNPDVTLTPGMFVQVRLSIGQLKDALLVNDTAITSSQAGSYVKVVGADGVVAQRMVQLGPVEGPLRVVSGGLKSDDQVVIGALQRAVVGASVEAVAGEMDALPAATAEQAPSASR